MRPAVLLLLLLALGLPAFAQPSSNRNAEAGRNAEIDREAAATAFAAAHHPELASLLKRLKTADRKAYAKAVREIAQADERFGRLKEKDAAHYEAAVRVWTLDSRIRLLAARLAMSDDPALEADLRTLLADRRTARRGLLTIERDKAAVRLERLDGQIEQLNDDPAAAVERDLARLKSEATKRRQVRTKAK